MQVSLTVPLSGNNPSYRPIIWLTISAYFFWGFAAAGNALLIAVFKKSFALSQFQAQLVELSFYLAYFSGSICYFLISFRKPAWLKNLSSRRGMTGGFLLSACGSLLIVPAAQVSSYPMLLTGLFIIGLGFTLQQIMANPLLAMSGDASNLLAAGSFNSFGNTIAPLLLGAALFGTLSEVKDIDLQAVKFPYFLLTSAYVLFALMFCFVRTPPIVYNNEHAGASTASLINNNAPAATSLPARPELFKGALSSSGLRLGMLAIFFFVGADVAMQSNLPALVASSDMMGLRVQDAVHIFSLFGGSTMAGMWTGALSTFGLSKNAYRILVFIVPLSAYALVLFINYARGSQMSDLYYYSPFLAVILICVLYGRKKPLRLLFIASLLAVLLIISGLILKGQIALYCIIGVACCCAFMWPCIFPLAISGLKGNTQQGASLLVMMIVGGAVLPPLQGWLSDLSFVGIHYSYALHLISFGYILFFSQRMRKGEKLNNKS